MGSWVSCSPERGKSSTEQRPVHGIKFGSRVSNGADIEHRGSVSEIMLQLRFYISFAMPPRHSEDAVKILRLCSIHVLYKLSNAAET